MSNDPHAYCEDQVRRFDRDRWLTTLFASAADRRALITLFAFNMEVARVRESVREPSLGLVRLQWWREAVAAAAADRPQAHPAAQALAALMRARPLPAAEFERMLTARELDLGDGPPATLTALEDYAAGTSAALTALCLAAIACEQSTVRATGSSVAIAWALVGLLRAVPFHAGQRRCYLPQDLLDREKIDIEDLYAGRPGAPIATAVEAIAERAAAHLRAARAGRGRVARRALPLMLPATLADACLRRLARARYDVFAPALRRPMGTAAARLAIAFSLRRF